ncbi:MAG TPA: TonB C-terminal domain-containing protein [archaeon]|nr:TonB C-terminal domain-containing protein [archaeon]
MSDEISLKRMFLISILLHLLFLLIPLKFFIQDAKEILALQPKKEPEEMTFIFLETPENAAESPVEQVTPYISDKNLAASNPEAPKDLSLGQPYQEGRSEIPAMLPEESSGQPAPPQQAEQQSEESRQETADLQADDAASRALRALEAFGRLAPPKKEQPLIPRQDTLRQEQGSPASPTMPRFDSRQTQAPVMGTGFQLSTYNWNWAPYLKELKRRIESNMYPPPAFYMGLVRGRTFLRFKILQDGSIVDFELIGYSGHESLKNTSVNSIEASVPFLPLPSDFPDDFLELQVGFYYNEFIR